jgi:hypothetical protein
MTIRHSEISMTLDTYSHVLPTMQREAINKLNTAFEWQEVKGLYLDGGKEQHS